MSLSEKKRKKTGRFEKQKRLFFGGFSRDELN
jgi:hypothetical protein